MALIIVWVFVCSKVANCIFDKMVQMLHTEIRWNVFFFLAFALHVLVGGCNSIASKR